MRQQSLKRRFGLENGKKVTINSEGEEKTKSWELSDESDPMALKF